MRRFLTLYMTMNWHREFAWNFATFQKVCHDFFTFALWFSSSPTHQSICKQTQAVTCAERSV